MRGTMRSFRKALREALEDVLDKKERVEISWSEDEKDEALDPEMLGMNPEDESVSREKQQASGYLGAFDGTPDYGDDVSGFGTLGGGDEVAEEGVSQTKRSAHGYQLEDPVDYDLPGEVKEGYEGSSAYGEDDDADDPALAAQRARFAPKSAATTPKPTTPSTQSPLGQKKEEFNFEVEDDDEEESPEKEEKEDSEEDEESEEHEEEESEEEGEEDVEEEGMFGSDDDQHDDPMTQHMGSHRVKSTGTHQSPIDDSDEFDVPELQQLTGLRSGPMGKSGIPPHMPSGTSKKPNGPNPMSMMKTLGIKPGQPNDPKLQMLLKKGILKRPTSSPGAAAHGNFADFEPPEDDSHIPVSTGRLSHQSHQLKSKK